MAEVEIQLLEISPARGRRPLPWPSASDLNAVRKFGFSEPVTVRPIPGPGPQRYEILAGIKTWLAAQGARMHSVPVYVRNDLNDDEAAQLVHLAEAGASDPIAEALEIQTLVQQGHSIAEAARLTGRTRTVGHHLLRLLKLKPEVQDWVRAGSLSVGQVRPLVSLPAEVQLTIAKRILRERLPVRRVEQLASEYRAGAEASATQTSPGDAGRKDADTRHLEQELSELLGSNVQIEGGAEGRGRLVIDFWNLETLSGILERMGYKTEPEY